MATLEQLVARSHGAAELTYSPFRAKGSGRAILATAKVLDGNGDGDVDALWAKGGSYQKWTVKKA